MHRVTGDWVVRKYRGEDYSAFRPYPLPPVPAIQWDAESEDLRDKANRALGRLDNIGDLLPDPELFLYYFLRKEAVLSSQIEGTQSSFSDLLLFEKGEPAAGSDDDVRETSNYFAAIRYGIERIGNGYTLNLELLRELHGILLKSGRGSSTPVGVFRDKQNWIGGPNPMVAEFVPPPHDLLQDHLQPLEQFLSASDPTVLTRAAMAHVQFETIHPFEDGNGRIGRLLITLLLCGENVLRQPTLYLSLYFKSHRIRYYDALQAVRRDGDWEAWRKFFFKGVIETSRQAIDTTRRLLQLFGEDSKRIQNLGRSAGTTLRVHELLKSEVIVSIPQASETLNISFPTAQTHMQTLLDQGIVREITGQRRSRLFAYGDYLDLLSEGTEPI